MGIRVLYWTFALTTMAAAVGSAVVGQWHARNGRVLEHRRAMTSAGILIGIFLISYVLKVAIIGKESLASWTHLEVLVLRAHESLVALMLLAGAGAGYLGSRRRIHGQERTSSNLAHKIVGRIAIASGTLGLVTAGMLLVGMYGRWAARAEPAPEGGHGAALALGAVALAVGALAAGALLARGASLRALPVRA